MNNNHDAKIKLREAEDACQKKEKEQKHHD